RQEALARRPHGRDHIPTMRVEVAGGFESIARGATRDEHCLHAPRVRATTWTIYRSESGSNLLESRHERPTLGSHRAASAARRVFEGHQRGWSLGCSLLG